jgi:REP element-mobilizing transposase RayT
MPDRVHVLVEFPPPISLSRFMRLRQLVCVWSPSWFVSAFGGAPLRVARRCVESQKRAA